MKSSIKYLKIAVNLLGFAVAVVFVLVILPKVLVFFLPFVIGLIIAMIANPLVRFLEKRMKLVRKHSSAIIIIAVLALIVLGGYYAISKISEQIYDFITNLPEILKAIEEDFQIIGNNLQVIYDRLPANVQTEITSGTQSFSSYFNDFATRIGEPAARAAGSFAKNLPSTLIGIVFTILSAYFFIADRDKIVNFLKSIIPEAILQKCNLALGSLQNVIGGYFKAQFKIMGIVAVILFVGFLILDIHYAALFALLIAILDFLPFLGTGTVLIPWAVLNFLSSNYKMAIGLLIIYGVSQVVRQMIQPKILGDTIGLNPFLTLILMYIGYKISSVFGMIISVPLGMVVINLYKAGVFDEVIKNIKELVHDINEFRKW